MNPRAVAAMVLAPLLGFLCFLLPIVVLYGAGGLDRGQHSVNIVSLVFERAPWSALALLALAGFGLRYFAGRGTWVLPILLMSLFPLATVHGVLMQTGHHNTFLIEFLAQLIFFVPALAGSLAAAWFARRKQAT
jgi:hypothetical protein